MTVGFLGWFRTRKARWQTDFEIYEGEISRRTGVSREKLREINEIMMELNILPRWEENE